MRGHEFHYSRRGRARGRRAAGGALRRRRQPARAVGRAARPGDRHLLPRHREAEGRCCEIVVIGIGTGNPEHMTVEAIARAERRRPRAHPAQGRGEGRPRGAAPRRSASAILTNPATRIVEFDLPRRDAAGGYREGVDAWHAAIAARLPRGCSRRRRAASALLVWGDPSLYDSTLRILDQLGGRRARVPPAGGAGHHQPAGARGAPRASRSTRVGGPVHVTTGRRLREAVPEAELDRGDARRRLRLRGGAGGGLRHLLGRLPRHGRGDRHRRAARRGRRTRIAAARAAARAEHGWIMDVYLLRRR